MSRSVVVERTLPHPPEKVWRALTEPALIADWLMSSDFAPEVGRRFQFRAEAAQGWSGVVDGLVLEADPPRRLSYRWDSDGVNTVVTFTLTPAAGETALRMEQSGFAPDQENNVRGAEFGWRRYIDGLERVVGRLEEI